MKCAYGRHHLKYWDCIHKDADLKAELVHRYLGKGLFTQYDYWTQKVKSKKTIYQIQWQNIWADIKKVFVNEWSVRYAMGAAAFLLFLKTGNPLLFLVQGAVAFDNNLGAMQSTTASSLTISYTCTGSNLDLVVFSLDLTETTTSVTYAGAGLTQVNSQTGSAVSTSATYYLFNKVGPATGANNLVGNYSGSGHFHGLMCSSFTGCDQTTNPDANATNKNESGTATDATCNVTTVKDNCWLVMATHTGGSQTAGTGTNNRGVLGSNITLSDSNGALSPAGTYTLHETIVADSFYTEALSLMPVQPTINNSGGTPRLMMGVGT